MPISGSFGSIQGFKAPNTSYRDYQNRQSGDLGFTRMYGASPKPNLLSVLTNKNRMGEQAPVVAKTMSTFGPASMDEQPLNLWSSNEGQMRSILSPKNTQRNTKGPSKSM